MLELRPCPPVGECVCAASPARNTRPTLNCSTIRTFGLRDVLSETFLGNAAHRGVLVGSKVVPADELDIWAADETLQESAHCGGVCRKRLWVGHITAADNYRPTVAARDARRTDEHAADSVSAAPCAATCYAYRTDPASPYMRQSCGCSSGEVSARGKSTHVLVKPLQHDVAVDQGLGILLAREREAQRLAH
jgi:hypothetical protein